MVLLKPRTSVKRVVKMLAFYYFTQFSPIKQISALKNDVSIMNENLKKKKNN